MIGALIGAGISAAGGLIGSYMNNKAQKELNDENLSFQRENLDYQKALQKQIFEREDTAHEREVADLRKAGLNPLLSTGAGAQAGSVVPTEALHSDYAPDYSGIASGFANAGSQIAQAEVNRQDLRMRQEMQREQIYTMQAQRAKIAADTANSLLGYNRGSAEFGEWSLNSGHRQRMSDFDEAIKEIDLLERQGRISHSEAEERRKDAREKREQDEHEQNLTYARNHDLPVGAMPPGYEQLFDLAARLLGHREGGVNAAAPVIGAAKEVVSGTVGKALASHGIGVDDSAKRIINDVAIRYAGTGNYYEAQQALKQAFNDLGMEFDSKYFALLNADMNKLEKAQKKAQKKGDRR